jgi:hypothetical protein
VRVAVGEVRVGVGDVRVGVGDVWRAYEHRQAQRR